jgi:hypothetical protein
MTKAAQDVVCVHPALDDFDGDAFAKGVVGPLRDVDRAHAAAPNLALYPVSAQASANHRVGVTVHQGGQGFVSLAFIQRLV